MRRLARIAALLLASAAAPARAGATPEAAFPVRMVELGGAANDPAVLDHVGFAREIGFNALWVRDEQAFSGKRLAKGFARLARWARGHDTALWVALDPRRALPGGFAFGDERSDTLLAGRARTLHARADVRDVVLSLDGAPTRLENFGDITRYGRCAAPAHLDLARRLATRVPSGMRVWLLAPVASGADLLGGDAEYAAAFLEGLTTLDPAVGLVWCGPEPASRRIRATDVESMRARAGNRPLLLRDGFPSGGTPRPDTLALVLAPLRYRDPALAHVVAGYAACPMPLLGGSRLALLTVADFLRDPSGYEPDEAARRALDRLAGPDPEARRALETQQMEWGGSFGERNDASSPTARPEGAARGLLDPALVDAYAWSAERYPGRMRALAGLADARFRDDLIAVMRRRLAIARALPLTAEYLARERAGRADAATARAALDSERKTWAPYPDACRALDAFLEAAGVTPAPSAPPS